MPAAVASRYARALVDVALSPSAGIEPARLLAELREFQDMLAGSGELSQVLASPAVAPARKRAVVERLAEALSVSRIARNFLKVLIDHRRAASMGDILDAFEKSINERMGILRVDVTAARELTETQRQSMVQGLEAATGKQVAVGVTVDADLIGGVIARI
ncbi:MAG: ATP synthase F1 subunit delta [Acidobacteria bacterium]|nr:ATP synthase F1 subunit delta [Acidobacteriota bacterium]